ncbi:hypothetical protein FRC03_000911 [Tulasnella sp. 419]|nr:hypothetical protein FRC03_000911 [Tulasnella sp. 419]
MDVNDLVNRVHSSPSFSLERLPSQKEAVIARSALQKYEQDIVSIQSQIDRETQQLNEIVTKAEQSISNLRAQEQALHKRIGDALAYLAPIRRLPQEILASIFLILFSEPGEKSCAWTLSRVNRRWRHVCLSTPVLWSAIEIKTTTALCPADTLRLWIERSGSHVPLDIDITLKAVPGTLTTQDKSAVIPRRRFFGNSATQAHLPSLWNAVNNGGATHTSLSPPHGAYASSSTTKPDEADPNAGAAASWGHIVFYYLVAQLHRWRRFRFIFGTPFPSLKAIDTIQGNAPLLQEFVVGCNEPSFFPQGADSWQWLPSYLPNKSPKSRSYTSANPSPNLHTLELRNVPFKYSSPLLSNLRSLKLVSNNLSVQPFPLNRIISLIKASPQLETLELNIVCQNAILPLTPVTLEHLKELKLGGGSHQNSNGLLQHLINHLITPALTSITIEAESRSDHSTMADTLNQLLIRSSNPAITSFTYGLSNSPTPSPYAPYHSVGFPMAILPNLYHLTSLTIQSCPIEPILNVLSNRTQDLDHPDDETDFGGIVVVQPPVITQGMMMAFGNGGATTGTGGGFGAQNQIHINGINNAGGVGGTNTLTNSTTTPNGVLASPQAPVLSLNSANNNQTNTNNDEYTCPNLRHLTFKNCHPHHTDGVSKLIKMVEARNPEGDVNGSNGAGLPRRLKTLEFLECGHVGGDVVEWLKGRIETVNYTEALGSYTAGFRCMSYSHAFPNN